MHSIVLSGLVCVCSSRTYVDQSGTSKTHGIFQATAACNNYLDVTATVNCPDIDGVPQTSCSAIISADCDLPEAVVVTDLVLCFFLLCCVLLLSIFERQVSDTLDVHIQTATDYSIQVLDPPENASDAEEWCDFFSRYGLVKHVTIVKDSEPMCQLLLKKIRILKSCGMNSVTRDTQFEVCCTTDKSLLSVRDLDAETGMLLVDSDPKKPTFYHRPLSFLERSCQRMFGINLNRHCMLEELARIEYELVNVHYQSTPKVQRVIVVFEHEEDKLRAHAALEVPDLYAIFDLKIGEHAFVSE